MHRLYMFSARRLFLPTVKIFQKSCTGILSSLYSLRCFSDDILQWGLNKGGAKILINLAQAGWTQYDLHKPLYNLTEENINSSLGDYKGKGPIDCLFTLDGVY